MTFEQLVLTKISLPIIQLVSSNLRALRAFVVSELQLRPLDQVSCGWSSSPVDDRSGQASSPADDGTSHMQWQAFGVLLQFVPGENVSP